MDNMIRVIVIDVQNILGSEVFDEVLLPLDEATSFVEKYTDMKKYRIMTV